MQDIQLPPLDPPRPEGLTFSLTGVMVTVFLVEILIIGGYLLFVPEFSV